MRINLFEEFFYNALLLFYNSKNLTKSFTFFFFNLFFEYVYKAYKTLLKVANFLF